MIKPAKHGRDHLAGGEDPVPFGAEWIVASPDGLGDITVSTTMELPHSKWEVFTNSPATFGWNEADSPGLLIRRTGLYVCISNVTVYSGYIGVPRSIYQSAQPLSSGPNLFGNELGDGGAIIGGSGQNGAGLNEVSGAGPSKSRLTHSVFQIFGETGGVGSLLANPWRVVTVLQHQGSNWIISSHFATRMYIVRLGNYEFEDTVTGAGPLGNNTGF